MRDRRAGSRGDDDRGHMPFGLPHLNEQPVAATDALQGRSSGSGPSLHRLGVPRRELWYPAAWRAGTDADRRGRWTDLADWVDWLIDAYRLPPAGWTSWWTTPGACEELVALRDWHRELCDVLLLVDGPPPGQARDDEALTAWHRDEQRVRIERASGLVSWHDALARCVTRLTGRDSKPLLSRETEATPLTAERRESHATDRRERLEEWLRARVEGSVPSATRRDRRPEAPATPPDQETPR
jgi:hypothetical protein